jgi:hypothetical protein
MYTEHTGLLSLFTIRSKRTDNNYEVMGMWLSADRIEEVCQKYVYTMLSSKSKRFHIFSGFTYWWFSNQICV